MIELPRLLPDQEDVDAVIDPDGKDETEGENVEEIERNLEQFHRGNHRANRHGEGSDLDHPKPPVAIKDREQDRIEERHQSAD